MSLLARCLDVPTRDLHPGDVLLSEDQPGAEMYVLVDGTLDVFRSNERVATISDPGVAVGEISVLLDTPASATVIARTPASVRVIDDPVGFLRADPEALFEVARTLAGRLAGMSGYLVDVKRQYADAGGHLGLLDAVLSELSYGSQAPVESGSERDPDPLY